MIIASLLAGVHDYQNRLLPDFNSYSAAKKQEVMWELLNQPEYQYKTPPNHFTLIPNKENFRKLLSFLNFLPTFQAEKDLLDRAKIIHSVGSVAKVVFRGNPSSHSTGLFREPELKGIARISLATAPWLAGFTPGMGVKFFVDGDHPSANLLVMHSVDGQGKNTNPFENTFSNVVNDPMKLLLLPLGLRFEATVTNPKVLSLAPMSRVHLDGTLVKSESRPDRIEFVAPDTTKKLILPNSPNDFRVDLASLKPGTKLYDVWVFKHPTGKEKVGELFLESPFIMSKLGDKGLFFKHESDFMRGEMLSYLRTLPKRMMQELTRMVFK